MKALLKFSVYLLLFPVIAYCDHPSCTFLLVPPGARSCGLGNAYTALADDALATFFNPAGLPDVNYLSLHIERSEWRHGGDLPFSFYALTTSLPYKLNLGLSLSELYLSSSKEDYGRAVCISLTYKVNRNFSAGLGMKYIWQEHSDYVWYLPPPADREIYGESIKGFALDFGLKYRIWNFYQVLGSTRFKDLDARVLIRREAPITLGLAVSNIGPNVIPKGYSARPLPGTLRLGLALNPIDTDFLKVILTVDTQHSLVWESDNTLHSGIELSGCRFISLRFGYERNLENGEDSFMWGFGFGPENIKLSLGYFTEKCHPSGDWLCVTGGYLGKATFNLRY